MKRNLINPLEILANTRARSFFLRCFGSFLPVVTLALLMLLQTTPTFAQNCEAILNYSQNPKDNWSYQFGDGYRTSGGMLTSGTSYPARYQIRDLNEIGDDLGFVPVLGRTMSKNVSWVEFTCPGHQLTLYSGTNFMGQKFSTTATIRDLSTVNWKDKAQSVRIEKAQPPQCTVCIYEDYNYSGFGHCEYSGYGEPDLDSTYVGDEYNDKISSISFDGPCDGSSIRIFEHSNFGGRSYQLMGWDDSPNLGHADFNDELSSLKIHFNQSPVVTITGEAAMVVPVGFNYVEQGASAVDIEDGSVNVSIVESTVKTVSPGTGKVTYQATDVFGSTGTAIRVVNVIAPLIPNPLANSDLKVAHSGKCLDVVVASGEDGANVQQWDCHGGTNQKWELVPDQQYFQLKTGHSSKCLDVVVGSTETGANVQQWDCHGGTNQKWDLVADGQYYQIKAVHSGKCLDVVVASGDNGATVQQWDCHGGPNQKWMVSSP